MSKRQQQQAGSNIKKIVVRIVFLVVGIPIIGSTYTQLLNALDDSAVLSDDYVTYAVATTFVDFESWVTKSNLAPLEVGGSKIQATYNDKIGTVGTHYDTWRNLRNFALTVNSHSDFNPEQSLIGLGESGGLTANLADDRSRMTFNMINPPTSGDMADDGYGQNLVNAYRMIEAYRDGNVITAASYASSKKSALGNNPAVYNMFCLSSTPLAFSTGSKTTVLYLPNPDANKFLVDGPNPIKEIELGKTTWGEIAKHRFGGTYNVSNNITSIFFPNSSRINFWDDGKMTSTANGSVISYESDSACMPIKKIL